MMRCYFCEAPETTVESMESSLHINIMGIYMCVDSSLCRVRMKERIDYLNAREQLEELRIISERIEEIAQELRSVTFTHVMREGDITEKDIEIARELEKKLEEIERQYKWKPNAHEIEKLKELQEKHSINRKPNAHEIAKLLEKKYYQTEIKIK